MPNISQKWRKSIKTGIISIKNPKLFKKTHFCKNLGISPLWARAPFGHMGHVASASPSGYALAPLSRWLLVCGAWA
jgi:hypothetical protein